ncbi:hypothetical protein QYF61_014350 [Mycteria americana]|uniref:Uncharacterized protein n=1 Tax=Mycteria americana TaxID=33587 RepID=A0AAN7NSF7_MYCAM|nr:hypothetical protein QYF61_014350 [Mycteria americana]
MVSAPSLAEFKEHLDDAFSHMEHLPLDQAAKAPSNLTSNISRDGASTTTLGNLFQCLTTLLERCSSPLIIFVALLWTHSNRSMPFLCQRPQNWDAGLQVGSHQSGVEGENHLPRPAGHASFDAAQDNIGFLGCKHTLPARIQIFIPHYPQVLLCRAALNAFVAQFVLILGIALTQVWDLVEPHEVHMGPLLKPVKVLLDGISSLKHGNCTTQPGALNPTRCVFNKNIEYYLSQYGPLRDATCYCLPLDIEPLTVTLWAWPPSQFLTH